MKKPNRLRGKSFDGVLEIAAAAFILLGPSLMNSACKGWGLYAAFAAVSACLAVRFKSGIHISFDIVLCALTGVYSLFVFAGAENVFGHIRFVFMLFTVLEAMLLAADYFALEGEKGLSSRLMYMIVFSADICAMWNILCWAIRDRFSPEPFSAGMGQSDLLGIFMVTGLWCAVLAFFSGKKRHMTMPVCAAPMLFVLIMSRSALTWFFGAAFAAIYLFKKNKRPAALVFSALAVVSGIFLGVRAAGVSAAPFTDALFSAFRHPGGLGGGGFISRQAQLQSVSYPLVDELGSGASLASSLGLFGLAAALMFIGRQLWLTFKYRSWFSAFAALLAIYAFFAPMESSLSGLILLTCVAVYSEWRQGKTYRVRLSFPVTAAVCCILAAAVILGGVLGAGEVFRGLGRRNITADERKAAEYYSTAASVNPFDGGSCYGAASALRYLYEQEGAKEDAVNAEYQIKRAIEREENNALYHMEYARLLADMGETASAVAEGDQAVLLAPLNDSYKLELANHLYALMLTYESGSLDAQRCYSRILDCAEAAEDMELKKQINDCADRAQPHTRIEFFDDGETEAEE